MINRLGRSASPYLLQHARNPVAWQPWDREALDLARREDRPIFLSIGYSACHWCHVMERESFEDEGLAGILNAHFVPIKVDREERPDLDDLYMGAVQALAGRGGWPMSVWLTPDLQPFFAGTYFPPEPRHGMPGFRQLLEALAGAWQTRRPRLEAEAARLAQAMAQAARLTPGSALPGPEVLEEALAGLRRAFDPRWGGFGPAPKFPQPMALELLLRRGGPQERAMAVKTLDAMAEGGLFDHLGGGFARYSVDARWEVPHFEKMLYDNAQLASVYLSAYQATGEPRHARIARSTLDYLLEGLRDPSGGFASSEDADSEGREGAFYVFSAAQIEAVLGPREGPRFARAYGVAAPGPFEAGAGVLHRFGAPPDTDFEALEPLRLRLRQARDFRTRPGRDDKVIAAWNGLALSALARAHQILGRPQDLESARALAAFLRDELWRGDRLLRLWRRGEAHTPGFLEDYGAVALGLLDLYETSFEAAWLRWAEALGERILEDFRGPDGGFHGTAADAQTPLFRAQPLQDGALPSGNTLAADALLRLARHLGRQDFQEASEGVLRWAAGPLAQVPAALPGLLGVLDRHLRSPLEIVIGGDPGDPATRALIQAAWAPWLPERTLSLAAAAPELPLHRGLDPRRPAARVCRDRTCALPVESPSALRALLLPQAP